MGGQEEEELFSLLGFSESVVAQYIFSQAKKATNVNNLVTKIQESTDLDRGDKLIHFAETLFQKVSKFTSTSTVNTRIQQNPTITNAQMMKDSLKYSTLIHSSDFDSTFNTKKEIKKKKKKTKRFLKKSQKRKKREIWKTINKRLSMVVSI